MKYGQYCVWICFLATLAACDGKPPKFVVDKLERRTTPQAPIASDSLTEALSANALYNPKWAADTLWNTGGVEQTRYSESRFIDGKKIVGTQTRLVSRQRFSREFYTASSDTARTDLFDVLTEQTLSTLADSAGLPVHLSSVVSVIRKEPTVLAKAATSWQSAGELTVKVIRRLVGRSMLFYHSQRGGEGDGEKELVKDIFIEDQLTLSMRSLNFKAGQLFYRDLFSTLHTPDAQKPVPYSNAECRIDSTESVALSGERKVQAWRLTVEVAQGKQSQYWFEAAFPHRLVKAALHDGTTLLLQEPNTVPAPTAAAPDKNHRPE